MAKLLNCPSCGEQVQAFEMFVRGVRVRHCSQCGAQLKAGRPAASLPPLDVVLIAQDSALLRGVLKEILEDQGISRTTHQCRDGYQLIAQCTERFKNKDHVDLIILDFHMQVIDGMETAQNIRRLEQTFLREKKAPLLFFSSVKCDETIKKFLTDVQPAAFIYQKDDTSPSAIATRVREVLSRLFGEEKFIPRGRPKDGSERVPLAVRQVTEGSMAIVTITGDLTAEAEEKFLGAVQFTEKKISALILDVSGVEYINSSGIAILIGLVKRAKASGFPMAISGATDHNQKLFTMVGLTQYVSVFRDLDSAKTHFKV